MRTEIKVHKYRFSDEYPILLAPNQEILSCKILRCHEYSINQVEVEIVVVVKEVFEE